MRPCRLTHALRAFVLCAALPALTPAPALAEGKTIIVLDASGSMWGQIGGRPKLEIAREALAGVLAGVPADLELGLMAYGHREKGACTDIELVVPPAAGAGPAISAAANAMKFLGKTPLTEAVRQAAAELRSSEAKATVILITDGIETCAADPCALGRDLEASGVDFTAHVVGFGLTAAEGRQVACLAENTGGKYIEAKDAGSLTQALQATVAAAPVAAPAPPPEPAPASVPAPAPPDHNFAPKAFYAPGIVVPDSEGTAFALHLIATDGSLGERVITEYGEVSVTVAPGSYRLVTKLDEVEVTTDVTIAEAEITAPEIILNAGRAILTPKGSADGKVQDTAAVILLDKAGERVATYYGLTDIVVPAGDLALRVEVGNATVTRTIAIVAGQTTEAEIVAEAGLAAIEGFFVPGLKMESNAHQVVVFAAKQNLDGGRDRIATAYGTGNTFTLPPGDYLAEVTLDLSTAQTPFTIKGGERTDVSVVVNAGVMAITAPGATSLVVFEGKADLAGNRERLHTEYGESLTLTAVAGDYLIEIHRGEVKTELTASVKPGERTELAAP